MDRRRHSAASDLGPAMRDRHGMFFMQAKEDRRAVVTKPIDQAIVQTAQAGTRIESDVGNLERAQGVGGSVAAEPAVTSKRGDRALQRVSVLKFAAFLALRPIDHARSWALTAKADTGSLRRIGVTRPRPPHFGETRLRPGSHDDRPLKQTRPMLSNIGRRRRL